MADSDGTPDSSTIDALLAMLETLRRAPDGNALLTQVQTGARVRAALTALIDRAFIAFAKNTTDRYAKTTPTDPATRLKLRVIDQRLETLIKTMAARHPAPELRDAAALEQHLVAALWALRQPAVTKAVHGANEPALERLSALQHTLDAQLEKTIFANVDSIASLGSVEHTLRGVTAGGLDEWRDILLDAAREIIDDYRALGEGLQQARTCVKEMARHTESHARTAALPGGGFDQQLLLQRLEAEARRAQRYRQPLSLALLGPDHLEDIRDLVGAQALREVLRNYQESVAACARAYDTVMECRARGLFWVLPGANPDQGVRALHKAQERITTAHYHFGGRLRPLPTFSAAVVGYAPGESSAALLARAETLAEQARRSGPSRIESEQRAPAVN